MTPSTNSWYYAKAGKTLGPVSFDQIKELALRGDILAEDVVLNEAAKLWIAANTVPGIAFRPVIPSPPVAANSKSPDGTRVHYIDWPKLKEIARWQRWLIVTALLFILLLVASIFEVQFAGLFTLVWISWIPLMFKSARTGRESVGLCGGGFDTHPQSDCLAILA